VRQQPIRRTLTVLLLIPLVSLIALWAYAATGTIQSALGKRTSDIMNKDVGGPAQALLIQLAQETAATFAFQSAHGHIPRTTMDAQRARTDAAISSFKAGATAAAAAGAENATSRPGIQAVSAGMSKLASIRAGVDTGTIAPLTAFQSYNTMVDAFFPFARGSLTAPDGSLPLYEQGEAVTDEAQALEFIGQQATLVGGVLASGGMMTPDEHKLFVQAVDNQRLLDQVAASPGYWQVSPDPYPRVFASRAYKSFAAMQDKIAASAGGTVVPVSPQAWQAGVRSVEAGYGQAETVGRTGITQGAAHAGNMILLRLFLVGGAGLLAVLISAILLLRFGNRITRELTRMLGAVRALADERLPAVVRRLRRGEDVDVAAGAPPLSLRARTREVARIADAFGAVQRTAVEAAVGQAELRKGVSNVFRSLARRNQSLLQRQLRMLDSMERATEDPDALERLFRLDHLTTRMRRQAEGLIILSGAPPGRGWRQPVPMVEVLRGAIGEIEDYGRVDLISSPRDLVPGIAVADVTHLLAELIENAALFSPPNTRIQVTAARVAAGFAVEIEDRGLGMPPERLAVLNERLANPPEFDLADSDQLGLLVVSLLAARHGIKVSLRGSPYGGISVVVLMPHRLVLEGDPATLPPAAAGPFFAGGSARGGRPAGEERVTQRLSAPVVVGDVSPAPAGQAEAPGGQAGQGGPPGGQAGQAGPPGGQAGPPGGQAGPPAGFEPLEEPTAPLARTARETAGPGGRPPRETAGSGGRSARDTAGPGHRAPATTGTHRGLPRRVRQANLASQLRDQPAGGPGGGSGHAAGSAERARALIASIQQGWRTGRADSGRAGSGRAGSAGTDSDAAGSGGAGSGQAADDKVGTPGDTDPGPDQGRTQR
jgi:signal transduction histidine kinase